jgi:hypothetical protein
MAHVSKGSVSLSVFRPKTVQFDNYKDKPYKVGIFVGRATDTFSKIDARNDTEYHGLKGAFKAILGNDAGPQSAESVSSGICYLPEAWLGPIQDALKEGGEGTVVEFVYEVQLVRRGEQDYSWQIVDLRPAKAVDPLASLIADTSTAPQIENKAKKPA